MLIGIFHAQTAFCLHGSRSLGRNNILELKNQFERVACVYAFKGVGVRGVGFERSASGQRAR